MPASRSPASPNAKVPPGKPRAGLTGRLAADTEPELFAFLRDRVNTFIKWDVIHFFHANPHAADTAENIARYIGRSPEAVGPELDEMAAAGLVTTEAVGGLSVHRLTDDAEALALLARFVEACADRQFRMRAIYYLVRAGRD